MKLLLIRKYFKETYTIGKLYLYDNNNNLLMETNTLEDKVRDIKIKDKTAIPCGTYKVQITYSNRFKKMMPLLLNVPGFDGIRIHSGNTSEDTSGCVLVGQNKVKGKLVNSKMIYEMLMVKLNKEKDIEIIIK